MTVRVCGSGLAVFGKEALQTIYCGIKNVLELENRGKKQSTVMLYSGQREARNPGEKKDEFFCES